MINLLLNPDDHDDVFACPCHDHVYACHDRVYACHDADNHGYRYVDTLDDDSDDHHDGNNYHDYDGDLIATREKRRQEDHKGSHSHREPVQVQPPPSKWK
ncbi:MAG: hypothetical protein LC540_15715, partial [Candidatus Thiodiazotropha sp.]|nr:hypothetical protein [Candidatus Thiodiazotropha sp.]